MFVVTITVSLHQFIVMDVGEATIWNVCIHLWTLCRWRNGSAVTVVDFHHPTLNMKMRNLLSTPEIGHHFILQCMSQYIHQRLKQQHSVTCFFV
jgi:hypothetical protein